VAPPTSYTEAGLKAYMHAQLGPVADDLSWSVAGGSYDEAITDTLLTYGENDIALALDMVKLRALAMVAAWRQAQQAAAGLITFSAFGDRYELGTVQARISASLATAEARAAVYDSAQAVQVTSVTYRDDPFDWSATDENEFNGVAS
jgi:hypothetical protein